MSMSLWNPSINQPRGRQMTTASGVPMGPGFMQPPMQQPALGDPMRGGNPMGRYQTLLTQGLQTLGTGSRGGGMGVGALEPEKPGGGMFDDMTPMEKMFLLTSGASAAADIGTGVYDRVTEARRERREEERRDRAGRRLSDALTRPYRK